MAYPNNNNGAVELQEVGNNLPIEPAEPNAPANDTGDLVIQAPPPALVADHHGVVAHAGDNDAPGLEADENARPAAAGMADRRRAGLKRCAILAGTGLVTVLVTYGGMVGAHADKVDIEWIVGIELVVFSGFLTPLFANSIDAS